MLIKILVFGVLLVIIGLFVIKLIKMISVYLDFSIGFDEFDDIEKIKQLKDQTDYSNNDLLKMFDNTIDTNELNK